MAPSNDNTDPGTHAFNSTGPMQLHAQVSLDPIRATWERRLRQPKADFNASTTIERLGLKRKDPDGSGQIYFYGHKVKELSFAVGAIADRLPQDEAGLVDAAVDPTVLSSDVDNLLEQFGATIWQAGQPGNWLLKASDGAKNYPQDLVYTNEADRNMLKQLLRKWVLCKAFNGYIRNRNSTIPEKPRGNENKLYSETPREPSNRLEDKEDMKDDTAHNVDREPENRSVLPEGRSPEALEVPACDQPDTLSQAAGESLSHETGVALVTPQYESPFTQLAVDTAAAALSSSEAIPPLVAEVAKSSEDAADETLSHEVDMGSMTPPYEPPVTQLPADTATSILEIAAATLPGSEAVQPLVTETAASSLLQAVGESFAEEVEGSTTPQYEPPSAEYPCGIITPMVEVASAAQPSSESIQRSVTETATDSLLRVTGKSLTTEVKTVSTTPVYEPLFASFPFDTVAPIVENTPTPTALANSKGNQPPVTEMARSSEVSDLLQLEQAPEKWNVALRRRLQAFNMVFSPVANPVTTVATSPSTTGDSAPSPSDHGSTSLLEATEPSMAAIQPSEDMLQDAAAPLSPPPPQEFEQVSATGTGEDGTKEVDEPDTSIVEDGPIAPTTSQPEELPVPSIESNARSLRTRKLVPTYNERILSGTAIHTPTKYLGKHYQKVLHGPLASTPKGSSYGSSNSVAPVSAKSTRAPSTSTPLAESSRSPATDPAISARSTPEPSSPDAVSEPLTSSRTAPRASSNVPLPPKHMPRDAYWDAANWRRYVTSPNISLSTIISWLGLHVRNGGKNGLFVEHPLGSSLLAHINSIASRSYTQLSTEDMITAAADSASMNDEIDMIFKWYAPGIWSMDADHSHLIEESNLVYEKDADRRLLWIHLHQWIYVRAFHELRRYGDTEEARAGVLAALETAADSVEMPDRAYTSETRASSGSLHPSRSASHASPAPSDYTLARSRRKRKTLTPASDTEYAVPKKPRPYTLPTPPVSLGLTTAFLSYLTKYTWESFDEPATLNTIEKELNKLEDSLPTLLGTAPFSRAFHPTLTAWLTYRRAILSIRERIPNISTVASTIPAKILRSRLLTELRQARDAYVEEGGSEALGADSVIRMGLGRLQEEHKKGEKVMGEVRWGLKMLEREIKAVGEELKEGGGRWILMAG